MESYFFVKKIRITFALRKKSIIFVKSNNKKQLEN
jgi:hypothetical protein